MDSLSKSAIYPKKCASPVLKALKNYRKLLERVDVLCSDIEKNLCEHITCHAGCSGCCQAISLFPVEAYALQIGLENISQTEKLLLEQLPLDKTSESCPLIHNNRCLIYNHRPIICRTHGFPILYRDDGKQHIDICPNNRLHDITLSGSDVIDIDRLNTLLVSVNRVFCVEIGIEPLVDRMTIVDVIKKRSHHGNRTLFEKK